jgi:hypothetical protein
MKRTLPALLSVVLIAAMPTLLPAKGATVKIILAPGLAAPVEIIDPAVRQFNVWSGPGTFVNGVEETQGFIIDWAKPVGKAPVGLLQYKVSFYTECKGIECNTAGSSPTYVVYYKYNPSAKEGFVYLPGRGGEFAPLNRTAIFHGDEYEGHWFRASKVWDDFVTPIIEKETGSTAAR